ncbi:neuronal acetylcholine receptor subunit alpha-6-like [Haliotis rufescens]|uniref:neuronal acetylcholine receptor subunit alpha-6-like n=1 Tax=Haliotis rufescens TaxID=6454 RepID=UPI00201EBA79|nr:neuronal acetylcholine receptor subunit alpha-6-like [Haliotis rufescens]
MYREGISCYSAFMVITSVYSGRLPASYEREERPKDEGPTPINVSMVFTSLNYFDVSKAALSTTFHLHMSWADTRLSVNGTDDHRVFYANQVWTPPLVVNNANGGSANVLQDDSAPLKVLKDGTVIWIPRVAPRTACGFDIRYFPYDIQICYVEIGSWVHPTTDVTLRSVKSQGKTISLALYAGERQWGIMEKYLSVKTHSVAGGFGFNYSSLTYTFVFQRQTPFYTLLMLVPFCFLSFLLSGVFLIPFTRADKLLYSLAMLVSLSIFMVLLFSILPPVTSSDNFHLGNYMVSVVTHGLSVIVLSVVLLCVHKYKEATEEKGKTCSCTSLPAIDLVMSAVSVVVNIVLVAVYSTRLGEADSVLSQLQNP